jgi:hypothetical protein
MNPTYVIKSVIQVDDYHNPKYCGTMDNFLTVCAFEGMKGLFQGIGPTWLAKFQSMLLVFLFIYLLKSTWVSFPHPLDYTFKPNILPY